jgi:hypothetical protein
MFHGKSQSFYFLTMLKVKIGDILPKQKNPFFICCKVSENLPGNWGRSDSFLPWTQKLNCSLQPCVSLQVSTFGPGHIYLIGTFDNANKLVSYQKSGSTHIGPLSQQYS